MLDGNNGVRIAGKPLDLRRHPLHPPLLRGGQLGAAATNSGKLNVYGAIAQNYRGAVGTTGGTGYLKDYKYDGRLATDEPPYFLAPLKAGWKVIRETAPSAG